MARITMGLSSSIRPHLFVLLGLLDDFVVEEVVRVDLVDWWQDHLVGVWAVDEGHRERVQEKTLVHVVTSPGSSLVEGFKVLSIVEEFEKSNSLLEMVVVEGREDIISWQHSLFIVVKEFFYSFWVL